MGYCLWIPGAVYFCPLPVLPPSLPSQVSSHGPTTTLPPKARVLPAFCWGGNYLAKSVFCPNPTPLGTGERTPRALWKHIQCAFNIDGAQYMLHEYWASPPQLAHTGANKRQKTKRQKAVGRRKRRKSLQHDFCWINKSRIENGYTFMQILICGES